MPRPTCLQAVELTEDRAVVHPEAAHHCFKVDARATMFGGRDSIDVKKLQILD
jgi:hypothetical protein